MLMLWTSTYLDVDSFSSKQCWLNFPILAAILYGFLFRLIFSIRAWFDDEQTIGSFCSYPSWHTLPLHPLAGLCKWFKVEGKQILTTIYLVDCKKVRWWEEVGGNSFIIFGEFSFKRYIIFQATTKPQLLHRGLEPQAIWLVFCIEKLIKGIYFGI